MRPQMLLSLNTTSFAKQAVLAKQMGFDGIDYKASVHDLFVHPQQILLQAKKAGIPIRSLHQPRWLIPYTPSFLFLQMIQFASIFPDLEVMNHHLSGIHNIFSNDKNLQTYVSLAKRKFICSFESNPNKWINHFFPKATYDPNAFAAFGRKNKLLLTLDTSHIAANGYDIVQFFEENHTRIAIMHISDYKKGRGHLPLGKGALPLIHLFQAIQKKKWNKLIVFEIKTFPKDITNEKKQQLLLESLLFIKKHFKG